MYIRVQKTIVLFLESEEPYNVDGCKIDFYDKFAKLFFVIISRFKRVPLQSLQNVVLLIFFLQLVNMGIEKR